MMMRLDVNDLPDELEHAVQRIDTDKERIVLSRGGKDVAVLVPVEDLETLELLEDYLDLCAAQAAETDTAARGEAAIDWEEAVKTLP